MASLPTTMRAAVLRKPGEPLVIETLNVPRPRHGEVLLKVTACGLCHSDLHVLGGAIDFPVPAVLGHEVSGVIAELGDGLSHSGLDVGQPVSGGFLMPCGECEACRRGRDDLCGPFFEMNRLHGTLYDGQTRLFTPDGEPVSMYSMGALAQYCVVPATAVAPLASGLDPVNSAILGCAAMTAYGAVRHGADLRYGESVAVVATGGVGSNILQFASAMGADPIIAIDVKEEKLAEARGLGATHTVNSTTEDVRQRVLEITGGRGVEVSFEALGIPATWKTALDALVDGGRMVPVGLGAGVQTAGVEINRTVRRGQSILGSYGARTRVDLPAVVSMAARGVIDVDRVVHKTFSLDEVNEGYAMLHDGSMVGQGVIDMAL